MLRHASLVVHDTPRVARFLAELLGAAAVHAPSPPFPADSWFVCRHDSVGTYLEVLPWGSVHDPSAHPGMSHDAAMRPLTGAHLLVSSPFDTETIFATAGRENWRVELADAGFFRVIKVWLENATLVEFLPPEHEAAYLNTFGVSGRGIALFRSAPREPDSSAGCRP